MTGSIESRNALIPHTFDGEIIRQRASDGYVNATALCKKAGKLFGHYRENAPTKAFLEELSAVIGIPITELVQSVRGGNPEFQGTWVHPQVAINLGQWASPTFAVLVSQWVADWIAKKHIPGAGMPFHLRRSAMNMKNLPHGYFSVLTAMSQMLIAPLEIQGYILPEKLWPDISEGLMFASHMKTKGDFDRNEVKKYWHDFEDGRPSIQANCYPNRYMGEFAVHITEVWIPKRAAGYFAERDPTALPFLQKAFPLLAAPKQKRIKSS